MINVLLMLLAVFIAGMAFDNWLCGNVLRPLARRYLKRPLEQDLWGLDESA